MSTQNTWQPQPRLSLYFVALRVRFNRV